MAIGKKTGGRKKGSVNKTTKLLQAKASEKGNLFLKLADARILEVLQGKMPCKVCLGRGRTKYQAANGSTKMFERTCQSCYGSGIEQLDPALIVKVSLAIREEFHPKLKAIEHSNPDGSLKPSWTVVLKELPNGGS